MLVFTQKTSAFVAAQFKTSSVPGHSTPTIANSNVNVQEV